MRGLAIVLICSLLVSNNTAFALETESQIDTVSEIETVSQIDTASETETVSQIDIALETETVSQVDIVDDGSVNETVTVSVNEISTEQEAEVSEMLPCNVEKKTDGTWTIENANGEKELVTIVGKTSHGYSVGIKNPQGQSEMFHRKQFEKPAYDWSALGEQGAIISKAEEMQTKINIGDERILVSSETDMLALAALSEQGETFKEVEIVQTENISFTKTFPGIGLAASTAEEFGFQGTFDGNGYAFYGLEHIADRGIFPVIGNYGVVKNVTLLAQDLHLKEGTVEFLNPLAERNAGTITNYHLEGNITAEYGISISGCVWSNVGTISDSSISGTINAQYFNIAGFALANVAGGKIIDCYNNCDIYTPIGCGHISGITGVSQGTILQKDDVEEEYIDTLCGGIYPRGCFPEIASEEVKALDTEKYGTYYYISPTIKNCYNYGNIKSESSFLAGIVGQTSPTGIVIADDSDPENVLWMDYTMYGGTVEHCINFGDISGTSCIGGIVTQYGELVTQCANYGDIKGETQLGGITGSGDGFTDELRHGIVESANFGNIIGNRLVGGISAEAQGSFHDNYNRGNICYNEAVAEENYILGGLAGSGDGRGLCARGYSTGTVSDMSSKCGRLFGLWTNGSKATFFYLLDEGTESNNSAESVTKEWLKSDEALTALGNCFKKDTLGINDGYPVLSWQSEKENKMKVRYATMGGSEVASQYAYGGELLTAPKPPMKDGAEFEGWYTDAAYTTEWDFSKTVKEPMCLYAKWNDPLKEKQWKVTISTAGGEYDSAYGYSSYILAWDGALLEEIEIPVRVGYRFLGWGIDGSTTDLWDFEKDCVTKDTTLEAVWEKAARVHVNLVYCGADDIDVKNNVFYYEYSQKLELEAVTKKNHEFGGWFTQENGNGVQYTNDMRIYEDVTLYAYWIGNERYTVTFESMGGSEYAAMTDIIPGNCIVLPTPVKENCVFVGWYTEPAGKGRRFTNATPITESLILYAFWKEDTISSEYRIVAIPNQVYTGSKVEPKVTVYYEDKLLMEEEDYFVTYANCVESGIATAYVKLSTDKTTFKLKYLIAEKSIEEDDVDVLVSNSTLNRETLMPEAPAVELTYSGKKLCKNRDYEIEVKEGTAKQATVVITGKGNFIGTRELPFKIVSKSITNLTIKQIAPLTYTGTAQEPQVEITTKTGTVLIDGKDYECIYTNNVNPGKAVIEIRGIGLYAGNRNVEFMITKKPMDQKDVKIALDSLVVYDGTAKKVAVMVEHNGMTLEQGNDYTVKFSNNTKASKQACVTIKGQGNYTGQRKAYFTILPKDIKETDIYVEDGKYQNGRPIKSKVIVKDGTKTLRQNKDYEVVYSNNKEIGEASVVIKGKGNYSGTVTEQSFRIVSEMITEATVEKIEAVTYDGEIFKPDIKVYYKNDLLTAGEDYIIQYPAQNNQNAGKGMLYVIGQGIFGGRKTVSYTINKRELDAKNNDFMLQAIEKQTYTGMQLKPKVNLSYKGITLIEGKDYKLRYQKNRNAGEKAVVIIQGMGNFKGTWKENFTILPANISDTDIVAQDIAYKKGKASVPKLTIKYGTKKLKMNKDYVISYATNMQCQDSEVMVKGVGNFAGMGEQSVTVSYHVYAVAAGKIKNKKISTQFITESERIEPEVELTYNGETLTENLDYVLSYENNTKPGKAKVVIRGIGRFGGEKKVTFQIKQK